MPEGGRDLFYGSDMRRAHLSRDEREGLDHKIWTQFRDGWVKWHNWAVQVAMKRIAVVWNLDKQFITPSSSQL